MRFRLLKVKLFVISFIVVFLFACSESTSVSGVISETESGKTALIDSIQSKNFIKISGIVKDVDDNPLKMAHVYLTAEDSTKHTYIIDSTETDKKGAFSFKSHKDWVFPKTFEYYIFVKGKIEDNTISALSYEHKDSNKDSLFFELKASDLATIIMYIDDYTFKKNNSYVDSICIAGSFICVDITENDIEKGFIKFNIPSGKINNIYFWSKNNVYSSKLSRKIIPGEPFYWTWNNHGYAIDSIDFILREKTKKMMDSLKIDYPLESIFMPICIPNKDTNLYSYLIDSKGLKISYKSYIQNNDTSKYWIRINQLSDYKETAHWISTNNIEEAYETLPIKNYYHSIEPKEYIIENILTYMRQDSLLCNYFEDVTPSTCVENEKIIKDSTFAASFWIKANGLEYAKTHDSIAKILMAGVDTLGFKILQCENDPEFICTKFYSKIESTDSTIYGKSKVLDGKKHHVSLVIYGKHLTIAIDGETIRSTDLKLSQEFLNGFLGIRIGDFELTDFITFTPNIFMKKNNEKHWGRISAWLNAFYELQIK